jgi:hypothetical protein
MCSGIYTVDVSFFFEIGCLAMLEGESAMSEG